MGLDFEMRIEEPNYIAIWSEWLIIFGFACQKGIQEDIIKTLL